MVTGISTSCAKSLYLTTTTSDLLQQTDREEREVGKGKKERKQERERDMEMGGMLLHRERHIWLTELTIHTERVKPTLDESTPEPVISLQKHHYHIQSTFPKRVPLSYICLAYALSEEF